MREYQLTIDEALKVGLSPEPTVPTNTQVLFECRGFKVGRAGLEAYVNLTNPLPSAFSIDYNWPYPQYITGELYNILIIRTGAGAVLYQVSDDHATIALIDTLTIGTLLEVADFGEYIFMTNGSEMIYWDTALSVWQTIGAVATIPLMRTICNFNGQAVGGNVVSAWHGCDETFYIWSKIGQMDFTPEQDNTAGFRRCPYGGEVYHARELGAGVIGYSSKGITRLVPVKEPAVTFGFDKLSNIGLINQGAINGDEDRQVYVGEDYILREITSQGIKELGYQQYMEELTGTIIVNYEPSKKDFYISNGSKTFLLSINGLTEALQHPSTVWRRNDVSYMLPDAVDTRWPLITTEVFDMGYAGQKTIAVVETDAVLAVEPEAAVDYGDNSTVLTTTAFTPINNQGVASITSSGSFFRFRIRFDSIFDTFRIGYINVRYKMTDLRTVRGVYAPPLRGQGG